MRLFVKETAYWQAAYWQREKMHSSPFPTQHASHLMFSRIAIIGTGLLGASIGLAVRRSLPLCRIVGIGRRQTTLDSAKRIGAIDEPSLTIAEGVAGCDLVVICTPVGQIVGQIFEVAQAADNAPIITDVGSTKQTICDAVESQEPLPNGCRFLGCHPIAGGEKTGPDAARATLFENRAVVLTPTRSCDEKTLDTLHAFWEMLGARISCMSPEEHDRTLARTSHLPHVVSAVLATVCDRRKYGAFCGTGYDGMTRLAVGSPELWRDILVANRVSVCQAIEEFEQTCRQFRETLEHNDMDAVMQFLEMADSCARKVELGTGAL